MYIIIAGGGIVGRGITKVLAKDHDVVVIDPSYENCEKVSSRFGVIALQGDATRISTLRVAYAMAGATNIGHSVDMMVNKFVLDVMNPEIRRVASLKGGKAEISIVTLKETSNIPGMTIADIAGKKQFPENVVIAGLFDTKTDAFIVPKGNTVIGRKNQVFLVGPREAIVLAQKFLVK